MTTPRPSRRRATPSESSPTPAATLARQILDHVEDRAAQAFPDARRLALALHNERQSEHAQLALSLALSLNEIAHDAHQAAELAAEIAEQAGEAALW